MRYISFKSTIISAMDNIGSQLLLNPKIWLLWIKVIEGMLKKEDRFILYKECLKQIPSESRELIKRDYADYCNQNHLSGDEFLNILLKVKVIFLTMNNLSLIYL